MGDLGVGINMVTAISDSIRDTKEIIINNLVLQLRNARRKQLVKNERKFTRCCLVNLNFMLNRAHYSIRVIIR